MKVICINADGYLPSDDLCDAEGGIELVDGEIYTVVDSFIDEGYCWYILEEDPLDIGCDSQRFENISFTNIAVEEFSSIVKEKKKKWYQVF